MAQSECLLSSSSTQPAHHQQPTLAVAPQQQQTQPQQQTQTHQVHVPKQEPSEFVYEYPPMDKRASWTGGSMSGHHVHHSSSSASNSGNSNSKQRAEVSSGYVTSQVAPPPIAHAKNTPSSAWPAQVYRQQHNTPLGSSPGVLPQEIYAPSDLYRRQTVFVSQAPYQPYHRIVPPPAHNPSNRQVT